LLGLGLGLELGLGLRLVLLLARAVEAPCLRVAASLGGSREDVSVVCVVHSTLEWS
jgi:hypothetical protein